MNENFFKNLLLPAGFQLENREKQEKKTKKGKKFCQSRFEYH